MKKVWTLMLVLALALGLCACQIGKEAEPVIFTFPAGTTVLNVDISGLTKEDAWTRFASAAENYVLNLEVDGAAVSVSAQEIDLRCDPDAFSAVADAMEAGVVPDFSGLVAFNEGKLRAIMSERFNTDVTEASIVFDEAAGQYVLLPDAEGQKSNPNRLVAEVKNAICTLTGQHSVSGVSEIIHPVRSADDPELVEAIESINKMLNVQLSYTFTRDEKTDTHEIPADIIRSFVGVGEDGISVLINTEAVEAYVTQLSDLYSIEGKTGSFQTTGGKTTDLKVSYNGHYVDNGDLTDDIIKCLKEGTSGTRTAPYQAAGIRNMPYGGTYIEVDLSSQHLWFYKNGECIVSSALVSGKVAEDHCTPTGVYSIYSKETDRYLTGADYRSFVNYWMPFLRGYGLHDATWRSSFGGDIYLYNGSHGCVNLPLSVAGKIYKNAPVGTKVILYGGVRKVAASPQKLTGTTSYDVANDVGTITLNIKPKYKGAELTYSSNNTNVATVDSSGKVTIKDVGTAKITVTAEAFSYYSSAETTVTIKVHSACDEGRHTWDAPTVLKEPTCQPGREKVTCTKCGKSNERDVAAVQSHAYGDWTVIQAETCGADGKKEQICSTCGEKKAEVIPATGNHTFSEWSVDKQPTCADKGSEKRTCANCSKAETRPIDATGNHSFDTWVVEQAPTCTETGSEKKVCGVCGKDSGETKTVDATGHNPTSKTEDATCTSDGRKLTVCKNCKETLDSETIPATGHDKTEKTTNATCTSDGKKVTVCNNCGETFSSETIPAKGHSYEGGSCKHCGAADPSAAAGE